MVYSPAVELLGSVINPERWAEWDPLLAKAKTIVDLDANNRLIYLKYRGFYDFLPRDLVCLQTWAGPDESGAFSVMWQSVALPQRPPKTWKGILRAENTGSIMVIQPACSTSAASLVSYMPCIDWKGYAAPGVALMLSTHIPLVVAGISRAVDQGRPAAAGVPALSPSTGALSSGHRKSVAFAPQDPPPTPAPPLASSMPTFSPIPLTTSSPAASPLSHFTALFNPFSSSPAPSPAQPNPPTGQSATPLGTLDLGPPPRAPPAGLREYYGVPSKEPLLYERAVSTLRRSAYQEGHLYLFAGHVAFGAFSGSFKESFAHEAIEAVEKVAPTMDVARSRIRIRHSGGKELVLVSENKRDVVYEAILAAALPKNDKISTGRA